MRPPDLEIKASMENRMPLRHAAVDNDAKSAKRESRLGFKSIFARHRVVDGVDEPRAARSMSRAGHGELVTEDDVGSRPYSLQSIGAQSETHLAQIKVDRPALRPRTSTLKSPTFSSGPKSPLSPTTNHKKRGSLATWDPVPLFQAYPQAVRTVTLPACIQAESLLRQHNKREAVRAIDHPDLGDEKAMFVDMARKKHRRNSSSFRLDWTTKLYVLVTSGYLLQYSGDGTHDRLPEKVVQLGRDSAAFASDVIPGRHWVLQVSSVFEDGALISQDTRSLLGKIGFREKEKRQASDILMVFENAQDMDSWMTLLRREIEALGGKRALTETGAPKEHTDHLELQARPSQRTLVVKDPYRFARSPAGQDLRWDADITFDGPELHLDAALTEILPEHNLEDNSTTSSFVSQDGRQLDHLRDGSNRHSFMSAARTIVTSDSSPSNSPIRDSFGSQISRSDDATPVADDNKEIRLRPNAADIDDRRQSYRTSNIFLDVNARTHRAHSSEPPNFSLPHSGSRRRSVTQGGSPDPNNSTHVTYTTTARPPRRVRRPPPPTLGSTRPLSIVADSPSPSKSSPTPHSPLQTDYSAGVASPPDSPHMFTSWVADDVYKPEYDLSSRASSRGSMRTSFRVSIRTSPRKYASTSSLRPTDKTLWAEMPKSNSPVRPAVLAVSPEREADIRETPRSMSSMDTYPASPRRSRSPISRAMAAERRTSMYDMSRTSGSPRYRSVPVFANNTTHRATRSDYHDDVMRSRAMSPSPKHGLFHGDSLPISPARTHSGSSTKSIALNDRRSLPQMPKVHGAPLLLPAGPPLTPPPNKALPPLPRQMTKE